MNPNMKKTIPENIKSKSLKIGNRRDREKTLKATREEKRKTH